MRIQGIDISSILKPEVKYVTLTKRFVPSLADSFPDFISYNENGVKIRELIVLDQKKNKIYTGYKYTIKAELDGGLTSLTDDDEVVVYLRAHKYDRFLTTELHFLGLKRGNPDKILILYDVPVIGVNKEELISQLRDFLRLWDGIIVDDIPAKIKPEYKRQVKGKVIDVD